MALPKIDKLSSEFTVSENDSGAVKNEIVKLGQAIFDKTNSSLKSATQSVIGDVPTMIKSLTEEIERGPVDSFGNAMNKLIKITQELGINLYDYNEGLAKSVEEFTGNQEKLEKKLNELREQGIRGTIENNTIKLLTEKEVLKLVEKRKDNEIKIVEKTTAREKLQLALDSTVHTTSKKRDKAQDAIIKNEKEIAKLKLDNEEIEKRQLVQQQIQVEIKVGLVNLLN